MGDLSPEDEAALASRALAAGDLPQAVHHLAGALAADPLRDEWLILCEEIFAAAPDAVALTSLDDQPWFGNVALHARALARDDQHTEAIHRLLEVATVRPDVPYLAWAAVWLDEPTSAADPSALVDAISRYIDRFTAADLQDPARAAQLAAILPLLERLGAWSEPYIAWFRAIVLRRLNRGEEAIAAAEQAFERYPSWQSAVAVANAHRAERATDAAMTWFERAATLATSDHRTAILVDLADLACERGDLQGGLARYEEILRAAPDHPVAGPSAQFFRWQLTGDAAHLDALVAFARAHRDNVRAQQLVVFAAGPPAP